jgi:cytidylate kinase
MSKRIVVAIDGPAGAGKSTIARGLAERLGFLFIDTGAMYRAVALWAIRTSVALDDMHRLDQLARAAQIEFRDNSKRVFLNGDEVTEEIRGPGMADAASKASTIPAVRRALVELQREMATQNSVVMEGRDIGTVVFPHAEVKIFLDARPEVRARRRLADLQAKGLEVAPEELEREITERDRRDRTRAEAPLVQAPDATYLDTSELSIDEVQEEILKIIRARVSNGKELVR